MEPNVTDRCLIDKYNIQLVPDPCNIANKSYLKNTS